MCIKKKKKSKVSYKWLRVTIIVDYHVITRLYYSWRTAFSKWKWIKQAMEKPNLYTIRQLIFVLKLIIFVCFKLNNFFRNTILPIMILLKKKKKKL